MYFGLKNYFEELLLQDYLETNLNHRQIFQQEKKTNTYFCLFLTCRGLKFVLK